MKVIPYLRVDFGVIMKDHFTWERLNRLTEAKWARVRILHPWPNKRFAVKHLRQEPYALCARTDLCGGCGETRIPTATYTIFGLPVSATKAQQARHHPLFRQSDIQYRSIRTTHELTRADFCYRTT